MLDPRCVNERWKKRASGSNRKQGQTIPRPCHNISSNEDRDKRVRRMVRRTSEKERANLIWKGKIYGKDGNARNIEDRRHDVHRTLAKERAEMPLFGIW